MRLLKLISTKARRRVDYECYLGEISNELLMVSKLIEVKAFGLFFITVNRYVIFFNEGL